MAGSLLRNKVIAITGSSSGIGRATAIACASQGAHLLLHHLGTPAAEHDASTLIQELRDINPDNHHHTFGADLTEDGTPSKLVKSAIEAHGQLDGLVNNAGICTFSPFEHVTRKLLERHLDVNFTASYRLAQAAAKEMIARGTGGSIVNIASITAILGSEQLTHYSASKAALLGMTSSFCVALGKHGIRINSVCPGTIETTMNKDDLDHGGKRAEMASRVPMARLGQPEDIAQAVVFFSSDLSRYVSGQSLLVDGGASVNYQ
ncbi:Enoyl-(Acyl carrier protein) reductase-like protein 31 [Elsinoe fawcettii]|nr:Enoyl-(Acyl carrier protein) reductase-like protein 31 [Elsinoe fawcettii]